MARPRTPKSRPTIFPSPADDYASLVWHLSDGPEILETFDSLEAAQAFCKAHKITPVIERECRYWLDKPANVVRFPIERTRSAV